MAILRCMVRGACAALLPFSFVLALSGVATAAHAQAAALSSAVVTERRDLAGLDRPGQIIVDAWGIPHIYGATTHDAFFLQGYNAARDRLWQIDLWRKRGLGRLSASFGAQFVEKDRAARLFLYRGDMAAEWATYPKDAKAWFEAFTAGINAYVAETKAGRAPLPVEFKLTGSSPELWTADDIVRIRSHALVGNLTAEVLRARGACLGAIHEDTLRHMIEPAHATAPPKGLEPCAVPDDVLTTYFLATSGVGFNGKTVTAELKPLQHLAEREDATEREGSNNWVVDAAHSATGRPILANDPHREHAVPSLRYVVDVASPDLHVIGAGEPSLPGVSFGHNDTVAWGLTIFEVDQQDLYVYDLSPHHPNAYRTLKGDQAFDLVHETLEVKGEAPRDIVLKFTRHGPVIAEDTKAGKAYAVRSIWSLPGGAGYVQSSWLFRANQYADFELAHAHWGGPPLNLVYADTHGDIGWLPSAFAPVRPNWDGLWPVPGDGRYEWAGLTAAGLFPSLKNPAKGWIATANEMNLPKDYPAETRKLGFEWVDRSRIDEIEARLSAKPKLGLADMMAIQTDTTSPLARRTTALLAGLSGEDKEQNSALALLKDWDGSERADSAQAALYEVWMSRHLKPAVIDALVPQAARASFATAQAAAITDWLTRLPPEFGADPQAKRAQILKTSLGEAWRETVRRLGPDPSLWRWGDLHFAQWTPAAAALAAPSFRSQMSIGPLQVGGSSSTPMATSPGRDFNTLAGASVRMVLDVGAWDNSRIINSPGQSGDPASPHYRDLFPLWAAGAYVPLLYSREAVERAAEKIITFTPAR